MSTIFHVTKAHLDLVLVIPEQILLFQVSAPDDLRESDTLQHLDDACVEKEWMDAQLDRCSGTSLLEEEEDDVIVLELQILPLLGT